MKIAMLNARILCGALLLSAPRLGLAATIEKGTPLYSSGMDFAEKLLGPKSIKCGGDLYFKALLPPLNAPNMKAGKYLVQMKSGSISIFLDAGEGDMDKLNDVTAKGEIHFHGTAMRVFDGHQWGDFEKVQEFPDAQSIHFFRKKGDWSLSKEKDPYEYRVEWFESPGDCSAIAKLGR